MACCFRSLLALTAVAFAPVLPGAEPDNSATSSPADRFLVRTWSMEAGLPAPTVHSLTQTTDGYLWAATPRGVARFDGVRFSLIPPQPAETPGNFLQTLAAGQHNRLWAGSTSGALSSLSENQFVPVLAAGQPGLTGAITRLAEDKDGSLWITTANGDVSRFRGSTLEPLSASWKSTSPGPYSASVTPEGTVSITTRTGLWSVSGKTLVLTAPFLGNPWRSLTPGQKAAHWFTNGNDVFRWPDKSPLPTGESGTWCPAHLNSGLETPDGSFWLATGCEGLHFFDKTRAHWHLSTDDGLGAVNVLCMITDREGDLWAGTENGGLSRIQPAVFVRWDSRRNLRSARISSLCGFPDGSVIAVTADAGISRLNKDRAEPIMTPMDPDGSVVPVLAATPTTDGNFLVSAADGRLLQTTSAGIGMVGDVPGPYTPVHVLQPDPKGGLWIGRSGESPLVFMGPRGPETPKFRDGPADVRTLIPASNGWLWIGTAGHGLFRWKDGQAETIGVPPDAPKAPIRSMFLFGETLWIATGGGGLWRWQEGSLKAATSRDGLPDDHLFGVSVDDSGNLWLSGEKGFLRIAADPLNAWFLGNGPFPPVTRFGPSDGLAGHTGSGQAHTTAIRGNDGRLWFVSSIGVVEVRPDRFRTATQTPSATVEQCLVNGSPTEPHTTIPPNPSRIEFTFTAPGLAQPENATFETRLHPIESAWTSQGPSRTVVLRQPPHGSFRFEVRATDRHGRTSPPASFPFSVAAPLWLRPWFITTAATALLLAAIGITRATLAAKLRNLREQAAIDRALLEERSRIARDMHDDLGVGLTEIAMLGDELIHANPLNRDASLVAQRSRELIHAMDETVWVLNPRHDSWSSTVAYLSRAVARWTRHTPIAWSFAIDGNADSLTIPSSTRQQIALACKESVHNAVKHSGASRMTLRMKSNGSRIDVAIEDNGRGFPPTTSPAGNGLQNLRERIAALGGSLQFSNLPDGGASVAFSIPLHQPA